MIRFLLITLFLLKTAGADPLAKFDEGVRLYDAKEYEGAARAFESILAEGAANGATYFNLGNAYYRHGEFGRAILNFERAVRYLPNDLDLQANLAEARRHAVDRIEAPLRLIVWDWLDSVRNQLNIFQLSLLLALLGGISALLLALPKLKPALDLAGLRRATAVSLALFALSAVWYSWNAADFSHPTALVLVEKADVYSAPDQGAKQLFTLHEGTKVSTRDSAAGWTSIRLADGRQGWLRATDVEAI
jgi:tetratricopeptide (TPR) repeat protein